MTPNKQKRGAGFTLIELLVVIAIMGIVSSMGVVGFRNNQKTTALNNSSLLFLDYFYQAQTRALSGGEVMTADSGSVVGEFRPSSYGVIIADTFDFDGEIGYTGCQTGCYYAKYQDFFFRLEDIDLKDDLTINSDNFDSTIVQFDLPRAKMDISVDGVSADNTILQLEYGTDQKCISIGAISGRMDITNCL